MKLFVSVGCLILLTATRSPAQVERVWLTHRGHDPSSLVVNWTTKEPGDSTVRSGLTQEYGKIVKVAGATTLHHVEIPLPEKGVVYHYNVATGPHNAPDATFKTVPTDELRVAVVANWHGRPDLGAVVRDDVHLLLTAGDNVPNLWGRCGPGREGCVTPYCDLIDAYPELFRSVPFMPVLGNHDREVRPRGDKPPAEPAYDVEATAFRRFFELPGDEWKWSFEVPDFDLRIIALDLSHTSDQGTTWQTCHPFRKGSPQYEWYRDLTARTDRRFVATLYNEKNSTVRRQEGHSWQDMLSRGTLAVSGFGHFGERAESDGFAYFNTSLRGRGDKYPDPASKHLVSRDNYLLMRFVKGSNRVTVEMRGLDGSVLDRIRLDSTPSGGR
jgi:hypothetical protein